MLHLGLSCPDQIVCDFQPMAFGDLLFGAQREEAKLVGLILRDPEFLPTAGVPSPQPKDAANTILMCTINPGKFDVTNLPRNINLTPFSGSKGSLPSGSLA